MSATLQMAKTQMGIDSIKYTGSETALGACRLKLAECLRAALTSAYKDSLNDTNLLDADYIYSSFERPRNPEFGDLATPLFPYVKVLKKAPDKIFGEVSEALEIPKELGEASFAGGYINWKLNLGDFSKALLDECLSSEKQFGSSQAGAGKRILVEYSSPNIAKPFGIGHLRSTIIGASLKRVFEFLGHETVGINYLGDWGTQFGKMIVAYRTWDGEKAISEDPVRGAYNLYVRFHEEEDSNPSLSDQARKEFKKLEDGNPESVKLWEKFKDVSHREFQRVYDILGVEFDLVTSESFLNDKMESIIGRLTKANLTETSRGALIVNLEEYNLPPALLRKQDGATLYATRDIAGLVYRWNKYNFYESLYIVGSAQADHFKQAFKVIDLLESAENLSDKERMTERVKHIPFGWVKFEDKALSTRRGHLIMLEDVLKKAIYLAKEKIAEKNPDLAKSDNVAEQIGVGAIIYTQLSVRRLKDVNFTWAAALNFEGETGPYLQYTHARLCSLIRKYGKPVPGVERLDSELCEKMFSDQISRSLITTLARFPEELAHVARDYEPSHLCSYLTDLATLFNKFYQRKNSHGKLVRIIDEDENLTAVRMILVECLRRTIERGLNLLGLKAPQEM
ncbi:MAG: arginine--tRNA ligase [candidate division Zixibacteria bacterium]|nr:arginine--tRNA ligase [candidate division Zixibacteria bacterium]